MTRPAQTKAERRRVRAEGPAKAQREQARGDGRRHAPTTRPAAREDEEPSQGIEPRLARIETALADQAEREEKLLQAAVRALDALRDAHGLVDPETSAGLAHALRLRREHVVAVDQPLALICQAQRSGGTLLARLFDGHPSCHVHPHELHIGDRRPHVWPQLSLAEGPEVWFEALREEKLGSLFGKGKRRIPLKAQVQRSEDKNYPLILPPEFQGVVFEDEVERRSPISSERQILDCYMTSLFNAWLDNQNLRGEEKRWVIAFSPRRAWGERLDKLFELYPDGRLISILRDPLSWYASALGRDPQADPQGLLGLWQRSAAEMLEASQRFEERVCVIRFDALVLDTPATMRHLAEFLDIEFYPVLTTPTFNGYAVGANSSYEVRDTGVVSDPVERYKDVLSSEQQELVRGECEELYEEALARAEPEPEPRSPRSRASKKTG